MLKTHCRYLGNRLLIKFHMSMELQRICSICQEIISYKTYNAFYMANKRNSSCDKCRKIKLQGKNNPFYGKRHSDDIKIKISNFNSKVRILSDEFIDKAKSNLSKVSNKKPVYDIWVEKYGKDIADKKLQDLKIKRAANTLGDKNPMYGKPSPQGSGNGWSGWYKNWYFRSIRELSYMIKVIEKQNLSWTNNNYKISYIDYMGKPRSYYPDFVINDKRIVEIKPKRLHNTPKVIAKRKAAEEFCQNLSMEYEIIDPDLLSNEEIKILYLDNKIKFLDKYDKKFKETYL